MVVYLAVVAYVVVVVVAYVVVQVVGWLVGYSSKWVGCSRSGLLRSTVVRVSGLFKQMVVRVSGCSYHQPVAQVNLLFYLLC